MLNPYTTLAGITFSTYTFRISLGILLSLGLWFILNRRTIHEQNMPAGQLMDLWLGGMIGGLLLARAGYVLLHFDYFAGHLDESIRLNPGGLDWHGAFIGSLCCIWLVSRWKRLPFVPLLDSLAVILPLLMLAAWRGCEALGCAYGAEITRMAAYPGGLVWEASDIYGLIAPRYATAQVGMLLAVALLVTGIILYWRGLFPGRRLWLMLTLMSLSMFLIGFLRGDVVLQPGGLRLDQWFDLLLAGTGIIQGLRTHPTASKTGYDSDQLKTTIRSES